MKIDGEISLEASYVNFTLLGFMLADFAESDEDRREADRLVMAGEWREEDE